MTTLRDREKPSITDRGETELDNDAYSDGRLSWCCTQLYTLKVKASAHLVNHSLSDCLLEKATKIVGCSLYNSSVRN